MVFVINLRMVLETTIFHFIKYQQVIIIIIIAILESELWKPIVKRN